MLQGQGEAERILQEARSIVESLDQIANSLEYGTEGEQKELRQEALRLRLTEKYLSALKKVLGETQVIMLPSAGGAASGSEDVLSPQKIATAMNLYKKIIGQTEAALPIGGG